jgi:hypothetical protein
MRADAPLKLFGALDAQTLGQADRRPPKNARNFACLLRPTSSGARRSVGEGGHLEARPQASGRSKCASDTHAAQQTTVV